MSKFRLAPAVRSEALRRMPPLRRGLVQKKIFFGKGVKTCGVLSGLAVAGFEGVGFPIALIILALPSRKSVKRNPSFVVSFLI